MKNSIRPWLILLLAGTSAMAATPPAPYGHLPSERQLKWHELEMYAFIHLTVNTFTDKEWGWGEEDPKVFNPSEFNADSIVSVIKECGLKGVVLTCKHHDGFCLWPSKYTEHSVKNSPWKEGKGDMIREFSDAAKKHGLKFGTYLSPWDRNHKDYAKPEYITYYRNQLRELLTNYGPVFEVWFDGANGGDGYYGGAKEKRTIDNRTYYDWSNTWSIVRELQPEACIFSDAGPDLRWVGNESGFAGETCWATVDGTDARPGSPGKGNLTTGDRPGTQWRPAEVDVSIRPGWFYHANEDDKVKSLERMLKIYYESVGRGANLILNIPPDRRGLIHENDAKVLREWKKVLDATFAKDLSDDAKITASNTRGNDARFAPGNVLDNKNETYWATDDGVTTPELILDMGRQVTFNVVQIREYLPLGQRVESFALDCWNNDKWEEFASATSIGNQRMVRSKDITTSKVRLRITKAPVCPAISKFSLYFSPTIECRDPKVKAKKKWKIVSASRGDAKAAIDGDPDTFWWDANYGMDPVPQQFVVDMEEEKTLKGFTYLPRQDHSLDGMVDRYAFQVSTDGENWTMASEGEFGNLRANPVEQSVSFPPVKTRYFKFIAKHAIKTNHATVAEIGVVEAK